MLSAKIGVIKIIREITGLGLVDAKGIADNGGNIKENIPLDEANEIKAKLESWKRRTCERVKLLTFLMKLFAKIDKLFI